MMRAEAEARAAEKTELDLRQAQLDAKETAAKAAAQAAAAQSAEQAEAARIAMEAARAQQAAAEEAALRNAAQAEATEGALEAARKSAEAQAAAAQEAAARLADASLASLAVPETVVVEKVVEREKIVHVPGERVVEKEIVHVPGERVVEREIVHVPGERVVETRTEERVIEIPAPLPGEDVVPARMFADSMETIDRLRGERNALHAKVEQMFAAQGAKDQELAQLKETAQRFKAQADAARFAPVGGGAGASPGGYGGYGGSAASPGAPTTPATATAGGASPYGDLSAQAAQAEAARAREECASADRAIAALVADLHAKEDQLERLAVDVQKYKQGMAEMGSTRAALYREHVRAKIGWAEERRITAERVRRAEAEAEATRAEARDAQTLVDRLKPGAESGLKEALAAAHSRLAVLQVREVRLAKALESAVAKEQQSRKDKEELELDVQEMSRAARERLAFHERRASESELRAARCRRELDLRVPRAEHAAVVDANRALQVRFKELLETRVNSLVAASQHAAAQEDAAHPRDQADASTPPSPPAQVRVRESRALDAAAAGRRTEGLLGRLPSAAADRASFAELRREVAEARAELDASKRAAQLGHRESARLEEAKADLERSVESLEARLAAAKAEAHDAREAERQCLVRLATSVSEEKHRAEMDALQLAEAAVARLGAARARAETRAAESERALSRAGAEKTARGAELATLRSAVRDMERRSDAAAALGRANDEILRLKGSDAQLRHHVQVAEAEADRLHADCLRLYKRLEVQDGRLHGVREDARELTQAQDAALARVENALAGRVDASEAEKWERALGELKRGAERREALLAKAQDAVRAAADRAEAAEAELRTTKKLAALAERDDADANLREIRRLGEELLQAKLDAARALRAESAANDRGKYLESVAADREAHLAKIEETVMREKQSADARCEDLQRKLRAAQRQLLDARNDEGGSGSAEGEPSGADSNALRTPPPAPRRRANAEALAAVGAAAAGVGPGAASAETQRMVLQQIEAIRALKLRAAESEAKAAHFEREIAQAKLSAKNAEEERDALRRRLEAHVAATSVDGGVGGARSAGEESAVAQVTAVAQSTVSRLQELVAEKNKALIKAQAAMTDLRSDALKKQAEDRRTIEELNDLLFKQNQREIKSMRDAVDFGGGGVSGGAGELAGAAQFAGKSQAQLVALLQEREQAIEVLTMKYEQQRARHEVTEARLAEQAEARDGEMKRVAQTAAPKPQNTRILETLVARLKTQMSQKDKRLAQLKEAIKELEKKLVDAMQKAAEASARGAEARSGENAAVRSAGDSRATVLAAKLKKTQDELQKAKQREERWEEERELLVRESRSATDAAVRSSAAARRETAARGAPPSPPPTTRIRSAPPPRTTTAPSGSRTRTRSATSWRTA